MHALEEKNQLSNEVQRMRKSLEDIGNQKVNSQKEPKCNEIQAEGNQTVKVKRQPKGESQKAIKMNPKDIQKQPKVKRKPKRQ